MTTAFEQMKYGPLGETVAANIDQTEGDPIGVYAAMLALYSSAFGGKVYLESGRPVTVWTVLIGQSSAGRKGTAYRAARALVSPAIGAFLDARTKRGISSGPSLVNTLYSIELETTNTEGGVDGRAMVFEHEWRAILKRSRRCPTFTEQMCVAWDAEPLSNVTKGKGGARDEQIVFEPKMGFHAHITPGSWHQYVRQEDALGGMYNRMLPVLTHRSKRLPYDHKPTWKPDPRLKEAYRWANDKRRTMTFTAEAGRRYDQIRAIIDDKLESMPEHLSCFFERAAEQVHRVAAVLTIPEQKTKIGKRALEAAWAFVQYSMTSVERLVTEAEPGHAKIKSLPEAIRDVLERNGGEATSTLMLRSLQARTNAQGLREQVDQMDDVEYYRGKSSTAGPKPVIYRFTTEDSPTAVENESDAPEQRPVLKVVAEPKVRKPAPKKVVVPQPKVAPTASSDNPLFALL
ncbi:DUF3987 domain-containing protein [Streptomyces sp. NPDC018045]|uniref:DUF3987 domain-containing protein n=1 Tax=Streptomyces sp. NPDC018045 TaxID=3365037 RepID=UPI003789481A